jgi:RNA polymerase sigma factor (sigma-70 family)
MKAVCRNSVSKMPSNKFIPRIAASPSIHLEACCKNGSISASEWIQLAAPLKIHGLEWHADFREMADARNWSRFRLEAAATGKEIPLLHCTIDFTHPEPSVRARELAKQKHYIEMTHTLGGSYCQIHRVPKQHGSSLAEGIELWIDGIEACLPHAVDHGVTMILENPCPEVSWEPPNLVREMDIFCQLVDAIDHPSFGIAYAPNHTLLTGNDPLGFLTRMSKRVISVRISGWWPGLLPTDDGIEAYLKALGATPRCSAEETLKLVHAMRAGSAAARSLLIKSNLRLVANIAKTIGDDQLSVMELISAGNLGLMRAVEQFDPAKGGDFSTYAAWLINLSIESAKAAKAHANNTYIEIPNNQQSSSPDKREPSEIDVSPVNRLAEISSPAAAAAMYPNGFLRDCIDFDAIFIELRRVGFDGWITVQAGADHPDQLLHSVSFFTRKLDLHWGGSDR